jgi:hypothetical protein
MQGGVILSSSVNNGSVGAKEVLVAKLINNQASIRRGANKGER